MRTDPIYLIDTYQREMTATVLVAVSEPGNRLRVLLDRTVFYPMGGGQPTDQGNLFWSPKEDGVKRQFKVYQVLTKDGEIWHYLEAASSPVSMLQVGELVDGVVDWERRYHNMRVHSAGHLLDFALYRMGLVPQVLTPLKGDHGKKPFVLYQGSTQDYPNLTTEALAAEIQKLVAEERELQWEVVSRDQLQEDAIYMQPGLPADKPLRKLTLVGVGAVADGGTQVRNSREVGHVAVTSIEDTGIGEVKVNYHI